jgi:hypothetical protein
VSGSGEHLLAIAPASEVVIPVDQRASSLSSVVCRTPPIIA